MPEESVAPPEENIHFTQPKGKLDVGPVEHDHQYEDFKAAQALAGIPKSEIADKVEFLEDQYSDWLASDVALMPLSPESNQAMTRQFLVGLVAEPLRILRLEIRELALALATEMNEKKAVAIRAEIGAENIKTQEHLAELKHFLNQHFESELESGRARGQNLYDVAKGIMLKQRPWWRRMF
jgi:hypothetical protein